ncbi:hypothetical protein RN001_011155 [Aquatica leii]|uniref:N-acyl-aliphatic-L-amino acid amidohydrolase n=1 Tax=Aquatica leii TaxID=1421715 RepID=A0AAN7P7P1_9COLE|nr:hypothetical protein RN001_011155 [Aquatica leii]
MSFLKKFNCDASDLDKTALENFLRYLRMPTVHPNVDYSSCVSFLSEQAKSLGLIFNVYYYHADCPVVVLTWLGSEPHLPSILLNSHMDVVNVDEEQWRYKPFDAEIDEDGNIYARGSQDTKSIGIQYLEAIRRLKNANVVLPRSVHVTFVPDEEIGGERGMGSFVKSMEFEELNVGFALDEGTPTEDDEFLISYGEKSTHTVVIHCPGQTGHASLLLKDTAGEKLHVILSKLHELRAESDKHINGRLKAYGEYITVNVTQIQGGTEPNVLPSEIKMSVNCRLPPTVPLKHWNKMLDAWCKEAGDDVWAEYLQTSLEAPVTILDESNKFWVAFKNTAKDLHLNLVTWILPGGSDCRYLRRAGVPALGFSPMRFTKFRLHEVDEHLNVKIFLEGIDIYSKLITAIGSA